MLNSTSKEPPLLLYNAWDAGSAQSVLEAGAKAIATSSWSVAAAQGYQDGEAIPIELAGQIVGRIATSIDTPVTVDFEGGALLRAIDGFEGHAVTRYALRLAPLVFVRPGELRKTQWTELNLPNAEWRVPAAKMKMRRPHRVPLAPQTLTILQELRDVTGSSKYLFPSVRSWHRPISDNTLNAALRRLGYDKTELTVHGLRSTASVLLNQSGKWHADAIERQLAHQEANEIRTAYTHAAEFWQERVRMMRWWADELDRLRELGVFKLSA